MGSPQLGDHARPVVWVRLWAPSRITAVSRIVSATRDTAVGTAYKRGPAACPRTLKPVGITGNQIGGSQRCLIRFRRSTIGTFAR